MVKATGDELKAPVDYRHIWSDHGSGGHTDFSFWEPIPPSGYTCVGGVGQVGYNKPSTDLIMCVKSSLVRPGKVTKIWNDRGSGSHRDVQIYEVCPKDFLGARLNTLRAEDHYGEST